MTQLSREVLATAPRVWQTVGPDMRIRVICPRWRTRMLAELEAAETRRVAVEKAEKRLATLQAETAEFMGSRSIGRIIECVCAEHGITRAELVSHARDTVLVDARTEAARRLRARGLSLTQIGRLLGRDHTTMLHALKKARVAA